MARISRRQFVEGVIVTSAVGLAGCTGGGDGDNGTDQDGDGGMGGDAGDSAEDGNDTDGADGGTGGDGDGDETGSPENATDGGENATGEDQNETGEATGGAPTAEDYPAVDEWLTESEVGAADQTYDGTIEDALDSDTVTVAVGAQGNGGAFAFDPSAVAVSTGTTVEWRWTGEGNPHNVVADPGAQIGESDYEFSSGDPVGGSGVQFSQTFDEAGIALYDCEPHLALGMKGAVVVVE